MGIPADGTYNIDADLYFISTTAATRVALYVDLVVVRAGVVVANLTSTGSEYYRGSTGTNQGYLNISATADLLASDLIELRMREASAVSAVFTLGGLNSRIDITEEVGTPTVVVTGFPIPGLVGSAYSGTLVADDVLRIPESRCLRAGGFGWLGAVPASSYFGGCDPGVTD